MQVLWLFYQSASSSALHPLSPPPMNKRTLETARNIAIWTAGALYNNKLRACVGINLWVSLYWFSDLETFSARFVGFILVRDLISLFCLQLALCGWFTMFWQSFPFGYRQDFILIASRVWLWGHFKHYVTHVVSVCFVRINRDAMTDNVTYNIKQCWNRT